MASLVLRVTALVSLLLMVATTFALPAQAVPSNPKGECFEVQGTDPSGAIHSASFYHGHVAKAFAAAWIAEGWTNVVISPC